MLNPEFQQFIRDYAVASKLSANHLVASFQGEPFIFIGGYPMTQKAFYSIISKAIFGESVRLSKRTWTELHVETRLLCEGLNLELSQGSEALDVIHAIKRTLGWTSNHICDEKEVMAWLNEVTRELEAERG